MSRHATPQYCFQITLAVLVIAVVGPAGAQTTATWTGATGNWSDPTIWSTNPNYPNNGNGGVNYNATVNGSGTITLDVPITIQEMTLGGAGVVNVSGGSLSVGGLADGVVGGATVNLAGTLALTVTGGGGTFSGVIAGTGSIYMNGTGTQTLSGANSYTGSTIINGGTLALGTGNALPFGCNPVVNAGATLNTGGFSNTAATGIATLSLNGGTFRVPTGSGDYYVNGLAMSGGTVDLTGTTAFTLHFVALGPPSPPLAPNITINAGTSTWLGGGTSSIQNDSNAPLPVDIDPAAMLNAGIIFSGAGTNSGFVFQHGGPNGGLPAGTVRLSSPSNTADMTAFYATLITNDLLTNMGSGAYGTLGTGIIQLNGGILSYDGATATSSKSLTLGKYSGTIKVLNPGTNLTIVGLIDQSGAPNNVGLTIYGPGGGSPSTLTLTDANTFDGFVYVYGRAILAVPTIADGGVAQPIGTSPNTPGSIFLGGAGYGRGDLLLTGTNANYTTNHGVSVGGLYASGEGGAIGVQNATTTLVMSGQILDNSNFGSSSLIKTGAGTLVLTNANNDYSGGTFVEGGTLNFAASGTDIGGYTISAGATVAFTSGNRALNGPVSAAGTVTFAGAIATVGGPANAYTVTGDTAINGGSVLFTSPASTTGTLHLSGGSVSGAGGSPNTNLIVNGLFTWTGGGFAGGLLVTLNGGATFTGTLTANNTWVNAAGSTVTLTGTSSFGGVPGGPVIWTNQPGSTFTLAGDANLPDPGPGSPFTNNGTFQKTAGTGTSNVQWVFTNGGTVNANSGTLAFTGPLPNVSGATLVGGTWHVIDPATLNFGAIDVQALGSGATVILEGPNSTFNVNNGAAVDTRLSSVAAGAQLQVLNGRNYTVANPPNVFLNSGTLLVSSNGPASVLSIPGGVDLSGNYNAATQTLTGGTWQVRGNAVLDLGSRPISTIAAGTTVELTALSAVAGSFPALNGLSINNGNLLLLGGQSFTTVGPLTNTGTIQLGGGTLTVAGAFTNTGMVLASGGGSVNVNGVTTVQAGATLTVGAGTTFGGSGPVVVNSGGTLTVQGAINQPVTVAGVVNGNATFNNMLTIVSGGFLRPGNSPGTITVGGGLTLDGDYDWDLNGNDNTLAGGTFDKVNGNGPVTLSSAASLNIKFGSGVDFTNGFWNQSQQWNILAAASGFTNNSIPQVTVNATSFQAIFPSGMFSLSEQTNSLDVNWIPGEARVSTWSGSAGGNWSNPSNWTGFPNGDMNTQLVFGASTNPALVNDIAGTFILNSLSFGAGSPAYTLTGNGLNFVANGAGSMPQIVSNSAISVTIGVAMMLTNSLTVSGTGNIAFNGAIGGPGNLTMNGTGILTLGNAVNSYSGGTNVLNGVIQVAADSALGTGNVNGASLGTLLFTGSTTTTKSFAMNGGTVSVAAGQTVTFNGGLVSGTFLDGSGTFATDPTNGARFVNVVTTPSVTIVSNSPADQFVHYDNGGNLITANNVVAGTQTTFNGLVNEGSGSITFGQRAQLNVSNFQSYGYLYLPPGGSGPPTQLKNVGTTTLYFGAGSRTFVNNLSEGFTAGIDLNGQNTIVAGGLFVNNGYLIDSTGTGHTVIADYGALVKGAGFFENSPITRNGGRVQAGNSPGVASFGQFIFGPGGVSNYVFAIDNATGVPGPTPDANGQVSGWGLVNAVRRTLGTLTTSGDFVWTADANNKLMVSLDTLVNPTTAGTDVPGLMVDFDPTQSYSWLAAQWSGTYTGPTDAATLDAETGFDTSGFANPIAGTFGWSLDPAAQTLSLTYTPSAVPEPGTFALVGLAGLGLRWAGRRRRVAKRDV